MASHKPELSRLLENRERVRKAAEGLLLEVRKQGPEELNDGEAARIERMRADLADLDDDIEERRADDARSQIPEHIARLGTGNRTVRSAGRLAPLAFGMEELRSAHSRIGGGETVVLETRASTSVTPLLPAELYPIPTMPLFEARLMDRLNGFALEAPSLEYLQVTSVTGAAGIVGEAQPKPEIQLPATKLITTALKLACHVGVTWESISDVEAYTSAVQNTLLKTVVDLENEQLLYGDPTAGGLNGMTTTANILVLSATGTTANPPNNFDDVAGAIAMLRTGPALCSPDLLCLHPDTWAAIRTQKDNYGRYLASADPTSETAESIWGVDVLQSTKVHAGDGILLDTQLMGRVAVRESLILRMGYGVVGGQSDWISNIVRWLAEERLNLAVERPAAICWIKGLPTAAPTETPAKSTGSK